jgi:hypothetical protein
LTILQYSRARLDVLDDRAEDRLEQARLLLRFEDLQRPQQRQAGVLQRRELTREECQLLGRHAANGDVEIAFLLLFLADLLGPRAARGGVLDLSLADRGREEALALDPLDRLLAGSGLDSPLLGLAGGVQGFIDIRWHGVTPARTLTLR